VESSRRTIPARRGEKFPNPLSPPLMGVWREANHLTQEKKYGFQNNTKPSLG